MCASPTPTWLFKYPECMKLAPEISSNIIQSASVRISVYAKSYFCVKIHIFKKVKNRSTVNLAITLINVYEALQIGRAEALQIGRASYTFIREFGRSRLGVNKTTSSNRQHKLKFNKNQFEDIFSQNNSVYLYSLYMLHCSRQSHCSHPQITASCTTLKSSPLELQIGYKTQSPVVGRHQLWLVFLFPFNLTHIRLSVSHTYNNYMPLPLRRRRTHLLLYLVRCADLANLAAVQQRQSVAVTLPKSHQHTSTTHCWLQNHS